MYGRRGEVQDPPSNKFILLARRSARLHLKLHAGCRKVRPSSYRPRRRLSASGGISRSVVDAQAPTGAKSPNKSINQQACATECHLHNRSPHGHPLHLLADRRGRKRLCSRPFEGRGCHSRPVSDRLYAARRNDWSAGLPAHAPFIRGHSHAPAIHCQGDGRHARLEVSTAPVRVFESKFRSTPSARQRGVIKGCNLAEAEPPRRSEAEPR